jgi:hypothetical protein
MRPAGAGRDSVDEAGGSSGRRAPRRASIARSACQDLGGGPSRRPGGGRGQGGQVAIARVLPQDEPFGAGRPVHHGHAARSNARNFSTRLIHAPKRRARSPDCCPAAPRPQRPPSQPHRWLERGAVVGGEPLQPAGPRGPRATALAGVGACPGPGPPCLAPRRGLGARQARLWPCWRRAGRAAAHAAPGAGAPRHAPCARALSCARAPGRRPGPRRASPAPPGTRTAARSRPGSGSHAGGEQGA